MDLSLLKDRKTIRRLVDRIAAEAARCGRARVRIMHVCGTHEDTIERHGLRGLLPEGVEIIPGPGCPVCVTTSREIDEAVALSGRAIVTTFGDLLKVPGSDGRSLADAKAAGGDVRVVYSIFEAVKMARGTPRQVAHVAVGFETTAPSTAAALLGEVPSNFSALTCHRRVPPALEALLSDPGVRIDGLIEPGHVSTIIGLRPYEELGRRHSPPHVVAGFEPFDVLMGVLMLLEMIGKGERGVRNEYVRAVRPEGNRKALEALDAVFEPCDVEWRGFPVIPGSGLRLRAGRERFDARRRFDLKVESRPESARGCLCADVLKGKAGSDECPLFGAECTPEHAVGACMVSPEGTCGIRFRYRVEGSRKNQFLGKG